MRRTRFAGFVRTFVGASAFVLFGPAGSAAAHGPADASDYRTEISAVEGDLAGATIKVVDFGERMEVTRTTAASVLVLGYQGEPYLRLDTQGVWRNTLSPATYLNQDRYAQVTLPSTVDASAPPVWELLGTGGRVAWHDHRSHWMSPAPPPITQGEPDQEHMIYEDTVALVIDGRDVGIHTQVFWIPPPSPWPWRVSAALLGVGAVALVVWRGSLAPALGLLAGAAAFVARPFGSVWLVTSAVALGAGALGLVRHRREWPALAGLIAIVVAVQRFDAFDHAVVPGTLPVLVQRLAIVTAVAAGAGALGGRLIGPATRSTAQYARPAP